MPDTAPQPQYARILPGDPAPWFTAASTSSDRYAFNTAAGRYIVLFFLASAAAPLGAMLSHALSANRNLFDDDKICFFGVSADPEDRAGKRLQASMPGIRYFWDFDLAVSRAYGAVPLDSRPAQPVPFRRMWIVLDPTLRVLRVFNGTPEEPIPQAVWDYLRGLPPVERFAGIPLQAPILYLPDVFEPEFCRRLIDMYDAEGRDETGFMRDVDGKTVGIIDRSHKSRRDFNIDDPQVMQAAQARIRRRVVPEIAKVHQFHVTRMERYLVGCYTAEDGGHFRPHRDNTTLGTAHRRFAVSVNLNSDFEGGEVSFPEYGPRGFKAAAGAAVVFS